MMKSAAFPLDVTKDNLPMLVAVTPVEVVTDVASADPVALGVTSALPAYITKVLGSKPTVTPVAGLV
jgi:hypothetical protein